SDKVEKVTQIRLMDTIYSRAIQVIVHLGDADDAHLAHRLLLELVVLIPSESMLSALSKHIPQLQSRRWKALRKLVQSPWFDRVWIIQEVALASAITVHYGTLRLGW